MNDPVREKLKAWKREIDESVKNLSGQEKADAIGLSNLVQLALGRLRLCDQFGILPKSIVKVLPPTDPTASVNFRVISDNDSNNREYWEEVSFDNGPLRDLSSGDLIVLK